MESRDKALLASRPQGGGLPFCPPKARILLPSLEAGPKRASGQPSRPLPSLGPALRPPASSIDCILTDSFLIWGHQTEGKTLPIWAPGKQDSRVLAATGWKRLLQILGRKTDGCWDPSGLKTWVHSPNCSASLHGHLLYAKSHAGHWSHRSSPCLHRTPGSPGEQKLTQPLKSREASQRR